MNFLIDGYWWFSGPISNRLVIAEQVLAWARRFPDDRLFVTVPRGEASKAQEDLLGIATVVAAHAPQHALHVLFEIPLIARRTAADAVYTQNFVPLGIKTIPRGVFVHDLMFETNPEWFTVSERVYFGAISSGLARASVVLTSSESERRRIERLHPEIGETRAVGLYVATELVQAHRRSPAENLRPFRFWLAVGRLNVRKNLGYTVRVMLASDRISRDCPLIVVGSLDGRSEDYADISDAVDAGLVKFIGAVSPEELAWLYSNCSVFVFGSLDEGFGLPPVEAQFFGAPTLVSDIPVMHEVTKESACYFPLDDFAVAVSVARGIKLRDRASSKQPFTMIDQWGKSVASIRAAIVE